MKKAFNRIAEALNEALSIARGEENPFKLHLPTKVDIRPSSAQKSAAASTASRSER